MALEDFQVKVLVLRLPFRTVQGLLFQCFTLLFVHLPDLTSKRTFDSCVTCCRDRTDLSSGIVWETGRRIFRNSFVSPDYPTFYRIEIDQHRSFDRPRPCDNSVRLWADFWRTY